MVWSSLEQLIDDLSLKSSKDDYIGLQKEIKKRIFAIHPDRHGGNFESQKDKEEFHRLMKARDYIEQFTKDKNALVPLETFKAIIKSIQETQKAPTASKTETLRTECRTEARLEMRARRTLPRISSAVFATTFVFFGTFSKTFSGDPLIGTFLNHYGTRIVLLMLAFTSGLFFLYTWFSERKEKARVEWTLTEIGRRKILQALFLGKESSAVQVMGVTFNELTQIIDFYLRSPFLVFGWWVKDIHQYYKKSFVLLRPFFSRFIWVTPFFAIVLSISHFRAGEYRRDKGTSTGLAMISFLQLILVVLFFVVVLRFEHPPVYWLRWCGFFVLFYIGFLFTFLIYRAHLPRPTSLSTAEKIAGVILAEFEERGAIERQSQKSLDITYKISDTIIEGLLSDAEDTIRQVAYIGSKYY